MMYLLLTSIVSLTYLPVNATAIKSVDSQIIIRLKMNEGSMPPRFGSFQLSSFTALVPKMNLYLAQFKDRVDIETILAEVRKNPEVQYAQKDHLVSLRSSPNDALYPQQWNMNNRDTGADIRAEQAWQIGQGGKDAGGNDIVVAIIDGGTDTTHEDLLPNLWVNRDEVPANGRDDDENGYIDDVFGWNAYEDKGTIPVAYHGTHVAGIVGANGNNGKAVAGVNWRTKIMNVAGSSGSTSTIVKAYGYVLKQKELWLKSNGIKGANVVATNSSFGVDYAKCTTEEFPVWNDLYNEMGKVGILSVAATINANVDVDQRGDVPTGCSSDYLITVTNTNNKDEKAVAGFGAQAIDLGAPGSDIVSTVPGGTTLMTGTSMASPHVAGAIALLHNIANSTFYNRYLSPTNIAQGALQIKSILLDTIDPIPALSGITVSGGRLNLHNAARAVSEYTGE